MSNISNDPNKYKDLPLVPETVLRKRHDLDELRQKRAAALTEQDIAAQSKKKKGYYIQKLEIFISNGKARKNGQIRYNRVLKHGMGKRASNKPTRVEVEQDNEEEEPQTVSYQSNSVGASVVFVARVRDHHGACPLVKRALSRLRLRKLNEGVFVRYDKGTRKLLQLVEPYVVYGPPTKSVVEDLLERRGFGKVDGKRVALSDNTIIEQALGEDSGMLCAEDLVHEIVQVGDEFSKVTKFLWPFRLANKRNHFERTTLKFTQGKDYGDKGDAINDFIRQVL